MLNAINALPSLHPSGVLAEFLQGQDAQAARALFVGGDMSRMELARDERVARCDGFVGTAHALVVSEFLGVVGRTVLPLLAVHASDPVGELSIYPGCTGKMFRGNILSSLAVLVRNGVSTGGKGVVSKNTLTFGSLLTWNIARGSENSYTEAAPGLTWRAELGTAGPWGAELGTERMVMMKI